MEQHFKLATDCLLEGVGIEVFVIGFIILTGAYVIGSNYISGPGNIPNNISDTSNTTNIPNTSVTTDITNISDSSESATSSNSSDTSENHVRFVDEPAVRIVDNYIDSSIVFVPHENFETNNVD